MKKYILAGFIILTQIQFFASERMISVQDWKKLESTQARTIWNGLNNDSKRDLIIELVQDNAERIQKRLKDKNLLYFKEGFNSYKDLVPHFEVMQIGNFIDSQVQDLLNQLFMQAHSFFEINDMQIVAANTNHYYNLLKSEAQRQNKMLKEMARTQDIIELLMNLIPLQNLLNLPQLPGNFARADSNEQKILKRYLLEQENSLD